MTWIKITKPLFYKCAHCGEIGKHILDDWHRGIIVKDDPIPICDDCQAIEEMEIIKRRANA